MKKSKLILILGLIFLAFAVSIAPVFGADGLIVQLTADKTTVAVGDNITYSYLVASSGNFSVSRLSLTDSKLGVISLPDTTLNPGENITATIQYTIVSGDLPWPIVNTVNVTGTDPSNNVLLAVSNNWTVELTTPAPPTLATDSGKTKAEVLKERGVPGKGIDQAPGLQKPFNPNSQAAEHAGKKK